MSEVELEDDEQEVLSQTAEEQDVHEEESLTEAPLPAEGVSPASTQGEGSSGMESAGASSGWQAALEQAGFQSFDDVDRAVQALVQSKRQQDEQIRHYADQVRFYQDQMRFRDNAPSHQASQEAPKPLDPLDELINDWKDPSWANQYIEVDEDGNRVIADHVDNETREQILSIDRKLRRWQDVLQDPRQFAQAVDQRVERMIQEKFESSYQMKQSQAQEAATVDSFINENANWLYAKDPATGRFIQDPVNGQYVYSDYGNRFIDYMDSFAKDGVSSVAKQIQYAKMAMGVTQPQQSQQSYTQSTQQAAQQQRSAMRGRTNTAKPRPQSFNGVSSESGGEVTGTRQMSFGEETLAAMRAGQE